MLMRFGALYANQVVGVPPYLSDLNSWAHIIDLP